MSCIKTKGGYRIRKEGRGKASFFPKVYKTLKLCNKRVDELKRPSDKIK